MVRTPETPDSSPVSLALLSPGSLRTQMQLAIIAIAQRRWNLLPNTHTPNISAFKSLISSRYGLNDDVPHRDLLNVALGEAVETDNRILGPHAQFAANCPSATGL